MASNSFFQALKALNSSSSSTNRAILMCCFSCSQIVESLHYGLCETTLIRLWMKDSQLPSWSGFLQLLLHHPKPNSTGDMSDRCHLIAVKLLKELHASQAVCETSVLINEADKSLQVEFIHYHKCTKIDETCPKRLRMISSTFFPFAVTKADFWLSWLRMTLTKVKDFYWFQKTQVGLSVYFWCFY